MRLLCCYVYVVDHESTLFFVCVAILGKCWYQGNNSRFCSMLPWVRENETGSQMRLKREKQAPLFRTVPMVTFSNIFSIGTLAEKKQKRMMTCSYDWLQSIGVECKYESYIRLGNRDKIRYTMCSGLFYSKMPSSLELHSITKPLDVTLEELRMFSSFSAFTVWAIEDQELLLKWGLEPTSFRLLVPYPNRQATSGLHNQPNLHIDQ